MRTVTSRAVILTTITVSVIVSLWITNIPLYHRLGVLSSWWRHQMETFPRYWPFGHLCVEFTGPVNFPTQRPVTRSCDVFFDLRPNKRLSKQWWGWWFETPSGPSWCHCNVILDGAMIGAINFGGGHTGYFPNSRHWYCKNQNVPNEI